MNTRTGRGWLTATVVVVAAALATLLLAVTLIVVAATTGHPVSFRLPTATALGIHGDQPSALPGVVVAGDATVGVTIPDPTPAQSAWSLLLSLPVLLITGTALTLVLLAVVRARRGDAFTGGVVAIMRAIGFVVLLGGPLVQLLTGVSTYQLESTVTTQADLSLAFTLDWPIAGLGILALAEVIRHGQGLREELDEVI